MDSRSAAHVLSQIGDLLEVKSEQKFKARAYKGAARSLIALDTDDLAPLVRSGELADTPGIGPPPPPPRGPAPPPGLRPRHSLGRPRAGRDRRILVPESAAPGNAGGIPRPA